MPELKTSEMDTFGYLFATTPCRHPLTIQVGPHTGCRTCGVFPLPTRLPPEN